MKASHRLKALRRATIGLLACWAVALMIFAVRLPAETPLKSPDRIFKPLRLDKTVPLAIPAGVTYIPLQLRDDVNLYSLTVSATDARLLPNAAQVTFAIIADGKLIAQKSLHLADPDWYCVFRADPKKGAMLVVESKVATSFRLTLLPLKLSGVSGVIVEAEPNDDWQHAQPVPLGATVIGTADDRPYFIAPDMDEGKALQTGVDWFKVEQPDEASKLVHFNLTSLTAMCLPTSLSTPSTRKANWWLTPKATTPFQVPTKRKSVRPCG